MLVRARFTRCAFYGVPFASKPHAPVVALPPEVVTAEKLDLVLDVSNTIWEAEDGEQLDALIWGVFEARGGLNMPLTTAGRRGWILHWGSWSLDNHLTPA